MALIAGHLGAAWVTNTGRVEGAELRDDATVLRSVAMESAPSEGLDAGLRAGSGVPIRRPSLMLDSRSALGVTADEETLVPEDGVLETRVRCGEVEDAPYLVSPGGRPRVVPGAMYRCSTVMDAPTFVLGLASAPGEVDAPTQEVRVIARRDAIPVRPWDRDRLDDAVWAITVPPVATSPVRRIAEFRGAFEPDAIDAVGAPGVGYAVAISLRHTLYVGWLSPQLAAIGPLHRVDAGGVAVRGAALAWNGREALVVFVGGEGAASRMYGARVAPRHGASRAEQFAGPATEGTTLVSPSVSAFGSGEWVTAWVEGVGGDDGRVQRGEVRWMPLHADLTAREPAHGSGPGDALDVAIAARAERFVLATLGGEPRDASVRIASGRCPSRPLPPPPPVVPAGDEVPVRTAPTASAASVQTLDAGVTCIARPRSAFRLAPAAGRPPSGPEIDARGVTVLERGTTQRGVRAAFRVRTDDGATGWIFLGRDELGSGCGTSAWP